MTNISSFRGPRRALLGMAALFFAALLYGVPSARADYEQVPEHFGVAGEAAQLARSRAIAVNVAGNGGVEAGSIYVVGLGGRVVRYSPGAAGEPPEFREAWGWAAGNESAEFQRCGPAYAAAPRPAGTFPTCRPLPFIGAGGEEVGHFNELSGVSVDQATGDVYVLNTPQAGVREHHLIEVFTASGTPVGKGFGDYGFKSPTSPESIAEGPEKLHEQNPAELDGIAVDESGTVYVIDRDFNFVPPASQQSRVMSFKPESAGDYEHYVYAGQGNDISTPLTSAGTYYRIALVGANRLVAGSKQLIREYPTGGGSSPICTLKVKGVLTALTANSLTGEVFYFVEGTHALHRLGPCDAESGQFEELQEPITPMPETTELLALAVNPSLTWGPRRPVGVVYGVDSKEHENPPQAGIGDVFAPAEVLGPAVTSESVINTTSSSSTLRAVIDPRGFTTSFQFEYLSEAEYLANGESFEGPDAPRLAPVSAGSIGGGGAGVATAGVAGLAPDTEYRFRVVVSSECAGPGEPLCEEDGAVASFRTYPPVVAGLPDGRAYELVSPAEKHGGEVFPADDFISSCLRQCKPPGGDIFSVFPMQSAPDGDAVSYMGYPFAPNEGAAVFNSYISRRTALGWQTTAMSPPLLGTNSGLAYSDSLDEGVITRFGDPRLAASAPPGYANLYLQKAENPAALQPLLTEALFAAHPPHREPGSLQVKYGGHSPDFSAQYFAANDAFTGPAAYAPEPADPGFAGRDLYEWRQGDLALVNVLPGNAAVATGAAFASASPDAHGVSSDGRRVYWTAGGHLYVREDGRTTREVHHPGSFLAASPDGLEVLLSDGCLYSLATASCADLTEGQGGFRGIAGASDDLSRIYFVDTAALPGSGQNERHEQAQAGTPNLYLHEVGAAPRFVATLNPSDGAGVLGGLNDWAAEPGRRTAEASPDGRYLAFGSTAQLTGYGNVGLCGADADHKFFVDVPCKEIFLYNAATGELSCPSCNPTGEAPLGNSTLRRIYEANPWLPQPRYLTDDGRLFFDSSDRLSPRDANGRVEDVYEAEPAGVGSCERATGCVSLISAGTGSVDSNFLAMDEDGENVFFTSRDRLAAKDTDELIDVYDARAGGGFQSEGETAGSQCQGEACQPASNPATPPNPGSSSFQGAGNVKPEEPKRCPKGKVKRSGRCVKKHKKRNHGGVK